jgi:hypothetical protein
VATDAETVPLLVAMLEHLGFVARYQMPYPTLARFLLTVRRGYRRVPYHNWRYVPAWVGGGHSTKRAVPPASGLTERRGFRHAFAVAHFCFTLLATQPVGRFLDDHEQLGLLLAAICHDIDHRGRNNAFMTRAHTPLAQVYSAGSVMEHHHLAYTMTLLSDPALNVLGNVAPDVYPAVLQQVRHVILATDLANHFQTRAAIRALVEHLDTYAAAQRRHVCTRAHPPRWPHMMGAGRWGTQL